MNVKYDDKGLVAAIIQNATTKDVLMLGHMNAEALEKTIDTNRVTFFSRSKNRLWTKGESSGNFLELVSIQNDCDEDALLLQVKPDGPTCHNGTDTCWGNSELGTINYLEATISERRTSNQEDSYVASLFRSGINKIAQKVGEEAVEVVIESKDDNPDLFLGEAADLFFHYLILLQAKGFKFKDVEDVLNHRKK